jgi:hypothetical protein
MDRDFPVKHKLKLAIYGSSSDSQKQQQPNSRQGECYNKLLKLDNGNANVFADYILAYTQDNPSIYFS